MTYLYCIQCGHMDEVYSGTHRKEVIHDYGQHYRLEWQECSGPFAYDAPPEMSIDVDNLIEPDVNEMAMMNENALSLLEDMQ